LTEDGLDLYSVVPVNLCAAVAEQNSGNQKFGSPVQPDDVSKMGVDDKLIQCMVSCHTLTTIDGQLAGDPLDVKMFEATGWSLMEPTVSCMLC